VPWLSVFTGSQGIFFGFPSKSRLLKILRFWSCFILMRIKIIHLINFATHSDGKN